MDTEAALARLLAARGQCDAARLHGAKAHAIAKAVEESLESSRLEARLCMAGDLTRWGLVN